MIKRIIATLMLAMVVVLYGPGAYASDRYGPDGPTPGTPVPTIDEPLPDTGAPFSLWLLVLGGALIFTGAVALVIINDRRSN